MGVKWKRVAAASSSNKKRVRMTDTLRMFTPMFTLSEMYTSRTRMRAHRAAQHGPVSHALDVDRHTLANVEQAGGVAQDVHSGTTVENRDDGTGAATRDEYLGRAG